MKKLGKIIAIASALLFATSMYFSCSNNAGDNNNSGQESGNGDSTGGNGDDKGDNKDNSKVETSEDTISFTDEEITILKASDISENLTSIKITVANVAGTTSGDWWFWANTDGGKGDDIKWKTGEGEACIYEVTITDATKIAYIKEHGLAIKGASGLSAKITTIIIIKTDTSNEDGDTTDNNSGNKENNGGDNNEQQGGNDSGNKENSDSDDPVTSDPVSSAGAITESGIEYAKLGINVKASTAAFPQDFVRGFDASTVYAIEKAGMKYLDADGKETDIFKVLKASGVNMIRLRIWNDPSKDDEASKQGNNNLEVTKALAKRATDAGMKYMLDFHFSDTWADPSNQKCPDAWSTITTPDEMKTKIADFVESTLKALKESAGLPAMVQLGNECEGGILLSNTKNDDVKAEAGSANFTAYINAAAAKVRAADKNIKIVMHTSRGGYTNIITGFINNTIKKGIDCDYIGLSYYPFFTSHKSLEELKASINAITATGKKAIISETSFCWTCDWVKGKCDNENNQLYYYDDKNNGLVQAAKSLVDSNGALVMGLTTTTYESKKVIAPTVQNQYNAVAAVMEAAAAAGADGVIYWGGDWITNSAGSVPSAMENQAFWDYDHKILDSAAVFSYGTQESNTAAGKTSSSGNGGGTLVDNYAYTADGNLIVVCAASKLANISPKSITVSVANVTGSGDWWASYDNGGDPWVSMKDGWDESIKGYKTTITDSSTISYFKENGIKIGMLSGLTATVTVTYE